MLLDDICAKQRLLRPLGDELLFVLSRRVGQEALSAGFFLIESKRNLRGLASFFEVLVQVCFRS